MELKLAFIIIVPSLFLMTESCDKPGCELKSIPLLKCCPFGQIFDKDLFRNNSTGKACRTINNFKSVFDGPKLLNIAMELLDFKIGVTPCNTDKFSMWYAEDYSSQYNLEMNGTLYINAKESINLEMWVNPEHFCINEFVEQVSGEANIQLNALLCLRNEETIPPRFFLTATCMLVSCVFILLTLGVYLWLPRFQKLQDRIFTVYLACLFIAFLLEAVIQLMMHYETHTGQACLVLTFTAYFALLSTFFWLNVMCYKMWKTFICNQNSRKSRPMIKSLRIYAVYAFGFPTILTILLISLEFSGLPENEWLPLIRVQGCFLSGIGLLLYLYGPISILCVVNIIFFIQIAIRIIRTKKQSTSVLKSSESTRHGKQSQQQLLSLCVRIFILMGINWILEVLSAYYQNLDWIYTDIYNFLMGLVIFVTFVCKKDIFYALKDRYSNTRSIASQRQGSRTTTTKSDNFDNSSIL